MKIHKFNEHIDPILGNDLYNTIFQYVTNTNPSSDAPYHNNEHMLTVANFSYKISNSIGLEDIDNLIVAALFHDYNHSMGKEKDDINVQRAIEAFSNYYDSNLTSTSIDKNRVIDIIRITEYPYKVDNSELDTEQKIIRDADLLQGSVDNWYDYIIVGLSKEMNIPIKDIAKGNLAFRGGINFNFDISKDIFNKNDQEVKNVINSIIE